MLNTQAHHPAADRPAPGARALYLGARDKKHVGCTAEALVVRNERAQTLRYPLSRLARIVSSTVVDWSGEALALCMRHHIGITWVDPQGHALGSCYPQHRNPAQFNTALGLWLEHPRGHERYQNWLKSRRMAVLMQWANQSLEKPAKATPPAQNPTATANLPNWEHQKRSWVYAGQFEERLPQALLAQAQAYTAAQLSCHGISPVQWGPDAKPIDLDCDLAHLLWAEMNLCSGNLAQAHVGDKEITLLFERFTSTIGVATTLHLASLHRTAQKALQE
jgi:hypothetical protein